MAKKITKKNNAFGLGKELDSTTTKSAIENVKTKITEQTQNVGDYDIESKLFAIYALQLVDSKIDQVRILRGALPIEVETLRENAATLTRKCDKLSEEKALIERSINDKQIEIKEAKEEKIRLDGQMAGLKNNRQYDALYRELEYQDNLVAVGEKFIERAKKQLEEKIEELNKQSATLAVKTELLDAKDRELQNIVAATEKEEAALVKISEEHRAKIESRLLNIYDRLRSKANNGLAVSHIERGACSGCYNQIPAQHQEELKAHKKILYCEYCRRILVDESIREQIEG